MKSLGPARHSTDRPSSTELPVLEFLTPGQVARIDALLATLGEYGEIHLVIQKGELRYINRVESHKAWDDEVGGRPS